MVGDCDTRGSHGQERSGPLLFFEWIKVKFFRGKLRKLGKAEDYFVDCGY